MQYPIPTLALHITVSMLKPKALPSKQNVVYLNPPPPRAVSLNMNVSATSRILCLAWPWASMPSSVSIPAARVMYKTPEAVVAYL